MPKRKNTRKDKNTSVQKEREVKIWDVKVRGGGTETREVSSLFNEGVRVK